VVKKKPVSWSIFRSLLVLEDEFGMIEVQVAGQVPDEAGPGRRGRGAVEERHGAQALVAARPERPLPGAVPALRLAAS
jgi:hypothetical protein